MISHLLASHQTWTPEPEPGLMITEAREGEPELHASSTRVAMARCLGLRNSRCGLCLRRKFPEVRLVFILIWVRVLTLEYMSPGL